LVEIALALGIVSFALVSLMALVPLGLRASKTATDLTLGAQIGRRVASMLEQADYSTYPTLEQTFYYFDYEGQPLIPATANTIPAGAIYTASIIPVTATTSQVDPNNVATVQIQIVNDPSHVMQANPAATPGATPPAYLRNSSMTIPFYIANNGR
jgi:uncharacterized protein (TIGR02598 family)